MINKLFFSTACFLLLTVQAAAHPHVFVTAAMELDRNEAGEFTAIHHNWVFDEIFSSTVLLDFDANGDGALDEAELVEVGETIKTNIAEYDFFTSTRTGTEIAPIFAPDTITVTFDENNSVVMKHTMTFEKPVKTEVEPLRISVSDPSFYVAFDFTDDAIQMVGTACPHTITIPDFDTLLSDSQTFTEAFFNNPDKPELGDEYYSWIEIKCDTGS